MYKVIFGQFKPHFWSIFAKFTNFIFCYFPDAPVKPQKTKCPECDQEFNATMYFVQHYKYVHGGLPPGFEDKEKFICDQCPSVFFNQLSLKLHYKTKHANGTKDPAKVGRRNCPHCEKTFATYLSYKEHIKGCGYFTQTSNFTKSILGPYEVFFRCI